MYEKGWGEFEMQIKIYFKKPFNKEPLTLIHQLGVTHLLNFIFL